MIQSYLKELLAGEIPQLSWKVDNYRDDGQSKGIIYAEGGPQPDLYEARTRYPEYMIWIRAKTDDDFNLAKRSANHVYDVLQSIGSFPVEVDGRSYYVQLIELLSEPNRIGLTDDGFMEYSVNIRATLN